MGHFIKFSTTLFLFQLLFTTPIFAQGDIVTFKFQGTVSSQDVPVLEAEIRVFDENDLWLTTYSDKKGRFELELLKGEEYVIEMSKEGFYPKRMLFRLNVDEEVNKLPLLKFDAELISLETYEEMEVKDPQSTSILDFPSAIIEYNQELGDFDYRMMYTRHIMEEIKNIGTESAE